METLLIEAMERHGIRITANDIPEVLRLGADTFLLRKGVNLSEKIMLEFYLILNELRQPKTPGNNV